MRKILVLSVALMTMAFTGRVMLSEAPIPDTEPYHASLAQRVFVGVDKCKTCHKKPEDGDQYGIWSKSRHSKAYETLGTEEAKKIAAEKGLGDPQKADQCLKCHVTGHGVAAEFLGEKYQVADGVGCESCHQAGGDYYKKSTMIALYKDEIKPDSVGLMMPKEKQCVACHNEESPTFKGFDFKEYKKKIIHPIPEAKKAEYKASGGQ